MEGQLVAVPGNVANINAMYYSFSFPNVFVTWGSLQVFNRMQLSCS